LWSRIPCVYVTVQFIPVFRKSVLIRFISLHTSIPCFSNIHFNIILPFVFRLKFADEYYNAFLFTPYVLHVPPILSFLTYWTEADNRNFEDAYYVALSRTLTFSLLGTNISVITFFRNTLPQRMFFPHFVRAYVNALTTVP
jgi:hypothetical protein